MSYSMAMIITNERNANGVERARKAGITDVAEAQALVKKYREKLMADRSEKNVRLLYWSQSVLLGARILSEERVSFSREFTSESQMRIC
jgi:folate-dependent phosphoribosylglycinamide formyltransferase PurN